MFKENNKHHQRSIFGIENTLPTKLMKKLLESEEYCFYKIIFCNIKEELFSDLYSDKMSRPNAPINCLVSALILKEKYNWSYEQLFKQLNFNILTKTALGLDTFDDIPFDDATIFNFQKRISMYEKLTGKNIFEQVFDSLTKDQLKKLKIKTNIQRSDSLQAGSNIRSYSRLQLLIEILLRLWRVMDESDKTMFGTKFSNYTNKSSSQYIYKLETRDLPRELDQLAEIYHFCKVNILPKYQDLEFFQIFDRVYTEHFTEVDSKIEVRPSAELTSSCLQSPDEWDGTYREKHGESFQGQMINVTETASQENPINLIDDVAVFPNNVDDGLALHERIDIIIEKTPDLDEFHTDGAYGNPQNDLKFEELGITHVQTAVRGRQCKVTIEIEQNSSGSYHVKCPLQSADSEPSGTNGKRYRCVFDKTICQSCQFIDKCPALDRRTGRIYFFIHEDYLRNKRIRNLSNIPPERRQLRSNVEATVHEFTCRMKNHKLKVRTAFKAKTFAYLTAIAINFGRIFRYLSSNPAFQAFYFLCFVQIFKEHSKFLIKSKFDDLLKNIFTIFGLKINLTRFFAPAENSCF
ncbi:transposase [Candidatus Nomurabacteria bacterium]|nr:transposase [Candidatus Nomurabacteria bacterium]